MTIPLRHFLVGFAFLGAGTVAGLGSVTGVLPGLAGLAHVHLLLVGWVCLTIMGAMTQFVPVWSGVALHSRRLASAQLWLVTLGLVGFVTALLTGRLSLLPVFGVVMLCGFWVFAYNVGRTLPEVTSLDVTERHFGLAICYLVLVTGLGLVLAVGFTVPLFETVALTRSGVVGAHATLAVFGVVVTTIVGALYQLATMFTQTELHDVDRGLQQVEEVGHPVGVLALAAGRLLGVGPLARVGGVLVLVSMLSVAGILARRLVETQVEWTPMLSRYAVAVVATVAWVLLTIPHWLWNATGPTTRFGAPGGFPLLVLGVVGFVVLGTLYHVVPFIVWDHQYSDRIGFADVPIIDDLYDNRLAATDCTLLVGGLVLLSGTALLNRPPVVAVIGGVVLLGGVAVFVTNMLLVVRRHSPYSVPTVLVSRLGTAADEAPDERGL